MLLSQPPTLLSLLFTILSSTHTTNARPNAPRELLEAQYHYLSERSCAGTVCGWSGQLCCTGGQTCSTNSQGQAECVGGSSSPQQAQANGNGQWQYFVTTYVESELTTVTSTYSSVLNAASTAAAAPAISGISCDTSMHESPCGTLCCAVGQYCAYAGQCAASNNEGGSSTYGASFTATVAPSTATAFIRPTSNAATTVTSTGSATTTVPFQTPTSAMSTASSAPGMAATSSNNGLSGGAIAGIVIGVIAGIILLLALCACFCAKGIIDGILDFFGLRSRRRREETYIEERRTHHAGGGGRTWYGGRINPSRVDRPKKSSGIGGLGWVAGLLAALALCLGLQRRQQEKRAKTEYSGSSYSYSDYTSESESQPKLFSYELKANQRVGSASSAGRTYDRRTDIRTSSRR